MSGEPSSDSLGRLKEFFGGEADRLVGDRREHYEIVREIGRGGMASVYEALDTKLGRTVALKVLREGDLERLRREATAAARLQHPNIVTIYEVGEDFIAMELVTGRTLAELWPNMAIRERVAVLETVARAAGYAHEHGVVHRDVKPENVLVDPDGRVVLTDFGLARIDDDRDMTKTGSVMGTPHYMAPEQVRGEKQTIAPATDVWALGVLLYEFVTGHKPFDGSTIPAMYDGIVRQEPATLAGPLGAIARKALEKEPLRRYRDGTAFADELRRYLAGESVAAPTEGPIGGVWRRVRRSPGLFAALTAMMVAAIVILALVVQRRHARDEAIATMRTQARVSLDAALALRRAGAVDRMRQFLPPLEAAYRLVSVRAPELAEVDYLLGRMHRGLMEDERALAYQDRALAKDPAYAPARYERAVLRSLKYARALKAASEAARLPYVAPEPRPDPAREDIAAKREAAAAAWQEVLSSGAAGATLLLAQGFLSYHRNEAQQALSHLEAAVKADPAREEGWELLAHVVWARESGGREGHESRLAAAEALLTQRISEDRGYLPHLVGRAEIRWQRGALLRQSGRDATLAYQGAFDDYVTASQLDPRSVVGWAGQGRIQAYLALYSIEERRDPTTATAAAEVALARALALDPRHASAWMWRGNARLFRGMYLHDQGADASEELASAVAALDEALRPSATFPPALIWRGRARTYQAAAATRRGLDPTRSLVEAEQDFARYAAVLDGPRLDGAPGHLFLWTWSSLIPLVRARHLRAQGADPLPALGEAEQLVARATSANDGFAEAWSQRALILFERASYLESRRRQREARQAYAAAAAAFVRAAGLNPRYETRARREMIEALRKAGDLADSLR